MEASSEKRQWPEGATELELALPLSALGLSGPPALLDFKWADNIQQTGDWSDFTLNGDVAPDDRFNYRAILPAPEQLCRFSWDKNPSPVIRVIIIVSI